MPIYYILIIIVLTVPSAFGETGEFDRFFTATERLSRVDFMQRVLENNGTIQARLSAYYASRNLHRAESGLFEPALVGGADWVDRQRPNTIQIERSLQSGGVFKERNVDYSAGVEVNTPLGGSVRMGAVARRLNNNIQRQVLVQLDQEYENSMEVFLQQPLLKGAGFGVTMAPRRVAAHNAEAVYQEYRRDLMRVVAHAEMAYWELSFAQEQLRYMSESVRTAEFLFEDSKARFDAGRGTELDVMEAQAGLALRRSRESAAQQRLTEAANRVAAYFGGRPQGQHVSYEATERPRVIFHVSNEGTAEMDSWANPDLLYAREQVEQQKVRVRVARNHRLPELNLRGAFGLAGLGFDRTSAYRDMERAEFPTWSVGLEFRVPLGAGIRERNELHAARQRLMEAEARLRELEWQLDAEVDSALRNIQSTRTAAMSNRARVEFRERLLRDRLSAHEAGRVETRILLEAEEELMAARLELLDSEVDHERAHLELQLLQGTVLHNRGIDLKASDLDHQRQFRGWEAGSSFEFLEYSEPEFTWPLSRTSE